MLELVKHFTHLIKLRLLIHFDVGLQNTNKAQDITTKLISLLLTQ